MFHFLHTYTPEAILITLGPIKIYWYGLFIVSGILAAIIVILKLAEYYKIEKQMIIDSIFYMIIAGIIGARLYHALLHLPYYSKYPMEIFQIWGGGLAIHGGIFAGLLVMWLFIRKRELNFWLVSALYVPGLALAQAIGRWGNYFNMELFGKPTNLPWGIPIPPARRSLEYFNSAYFHPAFLYESIGNLLIFLGLIGFHAWIIKNKKFNNASYQLLVFSYFITYSALRFMMEFIRVDTTPIALGLRLPQVVSLVLIIISLFLIFRLRARRNRPSQERLEIN